MIRDRVPFYMGGGTETEFNLQRFATVENPYEERAESDIIIYAAIPVFGELILDGRELANGEFGFNFYDDNGEIISFASNDADGNVIFEPVAAIKAGVYTIEEALAKFRISGESSLGDGLTYGGNEFVNKVKLDSNGKISDENTSLLIRFTVDYGEPEPPDPVA